MNNIIKKCPSCGGPMKIASLSCENCGIEIKGNFSAGKFDSLNDEQYDFLISFLKNKGNLKAVQDEKNMTYQAVKKALDGLLADLGIEAEEEVQNMSDWQTDNSSIKASEIIKSRLKENGGRAVVYTLNGLPCEIKVSADRKHIISNKLPANPSFGFDVFDCIVELLKMNGGSAYKGNGRNYKLGEPGCEENSVVGYIAKNYSGKHKGDSVFDPVFVFAAVLDWAGIAENKRGEISLTPSYKNRL